MEYYYSQETAIFPLEISVLHALEKVVDQGLGYLTQSLLTCNISFIAIAGHKF